MQTVLITGAAGGIGTRLRSLLKSVYGLRLSDLKRPPDLRNDEHFVEADLADAYSLTGFFLDRHAFAPRGLALPEARAQFVTALSRAVQ